ncbi:MAG: hypothetical protein KF724_02870 [Phycisphaeraceae bacterium]|nr:hypothetical protein [Phycisphaeraceae bacterium]
MAALLLIGGCDAPPETIVGSDVPQIVGLESRNVSGIERDGETLTAVHVVYRGSMRTPVEVAERTIDRYRVHGWTLVERRIQTTSARLTFTKGDRRAVVDLKVSTLNPAMGAGSVDLQRASAAAPSPGGTS